MTGKPIPKPTHTLTAADGFGNVLFTQTNEEGAALRLSAPTLDGYTFTGWTFATAGGTDLGQLAIMACLRRDGPPPNGRQSSRQNRSIPSIWILAMKGEPFAGGGSRQARASRLCQG